MKAQFRLRILKHRSRQHKAGISEVIATIILIVASVVLGTVAYVWAQSASVASQNNLGQVAQTDIHAVSERFEILATNFNYASGCTSPCSTSNVTIYFYNSGIYDTKISSLQITYTSPGASPTTTVYTCSNLNQLPAWSLPKGILEDPNLDSSTSSYCSPTLPYFTQGGIVVIKAVGIYGSYTTYQVTA